MNPSWKEPKQQRCSCNKTKCSPCGCTNRIPRLAFNDHLLLFDRGSSPKPPLPLLVVIRIKFVLPLRYIGMLWTSVNKLDVLSVYLPLVFLAFYAFYLAFYAYRIPGFLRIPSFLAGFHRWYHTTPQWNLPNGQPSFVYLLSLR